MADGSTRIFYDDDADLSRLEGRTVAIVGYGNQGRSQALNMRDSGVENVIVGSVRDESWERAEEDGFRPMPVAEPVTSTTGRDGLFIEFRTG